MGDILAEPKPGTALRTIIEEHRHLDEFMAMIKAKMELDEKYLRELKTLRHSWNPEWKASGIWPLISPLLTHINDEIDEREKATTELSSRFATLPNAPHPNATHNDGFDPLEMLENVETRYYHHEQCHKIISTPESINELKKWRNHSLLRTSAYQRENAVNLEVFVVPKHERAYRGAVIAQQTAAEQAAKWVADTLPDVLERHQQHAEDINAFLNVLLICYSSIYSSLSISCSTALSSNRAFSSSEFVGPRHDEKEKEASHALLRTVDYHDYMRDGMLTRPIFSLGVEKTASLINRLLDADPKWSSYYTSYRSLLDPAFELEKTATRLKLSAFLRGPNWGSDIRTPEYMACAFLIDEPLLPLPGDIITQYRAGISRAKLSSLMTAYLSLARQEIVTLLVRLTDIRIRQSTTEPRHHPWSEMAVWLCHDKQIIESIWRKWDIVNDRPLPEGVQRIWSEDGETSEVVWKKTGSPYYTSMSNSSV